MNPITIIWAIFTSLFFGLTLFHVFSAYRSIPPFKIKSDGSVGKINGTPVHTGFENFVIDFNSYLDDQNRSVRSQNWLTAIGYFLAAITALFSLLLTNN